MLNFFVNSVAVKVLQCIDIIDCASSLQQSPNTSASLEISGAYSLSHVNLGMTFKTLFVVECRTCYEANR